MLHRASHHRETFSILKYAVLLLIALLLAAWYILLGPSSDLSGGAYNKNLNAVWAEHAWVDSPHTVAEIRDFVERLARHGVKYVFLHVGPIGSDGEISPERYPELDEFLSVARTYGDRIVFLPWMGQLRSKLPLTQTSVRRNIVSVSKRFIEEYGMAGVHFDIEPIVSGDSDFLFLLEDVKKALGSDKILSVALEEYVPHSVYRVASKFIEVNPFLSREYLERIDQIADQIAVMTYENSIRSPSVYRYFVKNEVIWLSRVLKHARLLIGLPTYDKASPTFYPEAENIRNGLLGVIDGLNSWKTKRDVFEGVALYSSWTTDSNEWKTLYDLFIAKPLPEASNET